MLFIILFPALVILWVLIAFVADCLHGREAEWDAGDLWVTLGFVVMSALVALIIEPGISIFVPKKTVTEWSAEIQNIRDGQSGSGSAFLGTGTYQNKPMFFYYTKSGNTFTLQSAPAGQSLIVEDDSSPHVDAIRDHLAVSSWLLIDDAGEYRYVFHVPPGSVIKQFNLGINPMGNG